MTHRRRGISMLDEDFVEKRIQNLRTGLHIELISIGWIATESALSAVAAVMMGSLALSAFSIDSAIELISGMVLVVRLWVELQTGEDRLTHLAERFASAVVAVLLFALSAYIAWRSGQSLALQKPEQIHLLGLVVAFSSSLITPWLAYHKRRLGLALHSHALLGDAACSTVCAYMSWTLLAGLLAQWTFGWWWADPVAACGILYFILREALHAWEAFRLGMPHVHLHH